jgi:predicted dehydrogenase
MKTRFAFIGFQHFHVWDAWRWVRERDDTEVVACCEEDPATREALASEGRIAVTHDDCRGLLAEVDCDAVVVGDRFDKRGSIIIDCLSAGRHVLADKPACTRLEELARIEATARRRRLVVGMTFELRDSGVFRGVRRLVHAGEIGEVRAASFGGQHPLLSATRPAWYHEEGRHGGTINDIGIHGIDLLPWITGQRWSRVVAARCWQRGVPAGSHLRNAAQLMLAMENDCGVLADVSYLAPDSMGYTTPLYWRLTLWGSRGVIEAGLNSTLISLYREGANEGIAVPPDPPDPGGYLESFLREVRGDTAGDDGRLTSRDVFAASRVALMAQEAADQGLRDVLL